MITFRNKYRKYLVIGTLTALVSLPQAIPAGTSAWAGDFDIKFHNGQLSAKLKNSSLKEVLAEVMQQSKAKIWINDSIDNTVVTAEFHDLPIREGISKILKDKNYAFIYSPNETKDGKISFIENNKSGINYSRFHEPVEDPMDDPQRRLSPPVEEADEEKPTLEALVKDALENESIEKREEAVIALGENKSKEAIDIISKVLTSDQNEDVRLTAIDALLSIGDATIVQPLSAGLKDQKPSVRESTIEALGAIGDKSAIEFIKNAVNDEDESVRELAKETLAEFTSDRQQ